MGCHLTQAWTPAQSYLSAMPFHHPPSAGQRTCETSRSTEENLTCGGKLAPSPDTSTCAQSRQRAGLPTARLGWLHVPDVLLARASLPGIASHQPHRRAVLAQAALPTALHLLTEWDLPAPLTRCSLAMKTTASAEENSKLPKCPSSQRLSKAPTALAVTL